MTESRVESDGPGTMENYQKIEKIGEGMGY
jgi:hypothetical protein